MRRFLICAAFFCTVGTLDPGRLRSQSRWVLEALAGVSGAPADSERGVGVSVEASVLRSLGHGTHSLGADVGYLGGGSTPERKTLLLRNPLDPMPGDTLQAVLTSSLGTWYLGLTYRITPMVVGGRLSVRLGIGGARTTNTSTVEAFDLSSQFLARSSSSRSTWGAFGRVGINVTVAELSRRLAFKLSGDAFVLTVGEGATAYLRGGIGLGFRL